MSGFSPDFQPEGAIDFLKEAVGKETRSMLE